MTLMRLVWPAALGLIIAGCAPSWAPRITEIQSPALAGASAEPRLSSFGGRIVLSWIERKAAHDAEVAWLKFSERTPKGWTPETTVATGENWFLNAADVPSVIRIDDTTLAAHWLESNGADPEGYDVKLVFSHDDGRTWSAPTTPHHDRTPTEHGFASLYPSPDGGLGLVWLDGRDGETMAVRAARFSKDGSQMSETVVKDHVCECCPTAVAVTANGAIVAFRNLGDRDVRDIYVARSPAGSSPSSPSWAAPIPVHGDGWQIDACPVNGPAVTADGQAVAVAWFNAKVDQGRVFVTFSTDGGNTFGDAVRVDDGGSLGRVDVALLDHQSAVVGWIEYTGGRSEFRMRRVASDGSRSASTVISALGTGRPSGYPRMARAGRELLFAWTESQDGLTRVRTASWEMR